MSSLVHVTSQEQAQQVPIQGQALRAANGDGLFSFPFGFSLQSHSRHRQLQDSDEEDANDLSPFITASLVAAVIIAVYATVQITTTLYNFKFNYCKVHSVVLSMS